MKSLICLSLVFLVQGAAFAQGAPTKPTPEQQQAAQQRFAAQIEKFMALQERHTTKVDGAINAAGLRRGEALTLFFTHGLPNDDAALAKAALERFGATGADVAVLKEASQVRSQAPPPVDTCARLLDGSLPDGLSMAKFVAKTRDDAEADTAQRYQSVIDKLSPRVRANVLQKYNEEAAAVSSSTIDHVGMAQEDPELYKLGMTSACRGRKSAPQLPPSPPAPGEVHGIR